MMMAPKKILLAEDDEDDRELFKSFLKDRADIVLLPAAENGEVLLEYLLQAKDPDSIPDIIILDQNMPRRNGLQTLQVLTQSDSFKHIPVIIYSTYVDEQLTKQGEALGAKMVFPKPVTPEGYHQMINTFLEVLW